MVNPVKYYLDTPGGKRLIGIEPVYEEIAGGDLFPTGRYILSEANNVIGELRFDGDLFEWDCIDSVPSEEMFRIAQFISEYNEPELAGYLD